MSPNRSARADTPRLRRFKESDRARLSALDLLFALLLHILVITLIAILAFIQKQSHHEPLKRIEVAMISAKELARMQQQTKRPKPQARKPRISKPKPKPMPRPKAKPAPKPAPSEAFDPFAPLVSKSDTRTATTPRPELADLAGKQLSKQEIDRYIALIQDAVQRHWKLPAALGKVRDPLVEMRLNPDGSVASIRLLESSGHAALDASLMRAIRAAAPFQVPPREQFEFFRINRVRFHPIK